MRLTIARRYRGPLDSANGGYAAGLLAERLDGPAEVTLRLPPPLETELEVRGSPAEGLLLLHGERVVAEARPCAPGVTVPPLPDAAQLDAAGAHDPGWQAPTVFGECFSCGRRGDGSGLAIHPLPVPGTGLVAARWVAEEVSTPVVWAAIDCAGAYAVGGPGRGEPVLARMTAAIERLPAEGEPCVVLGWPLAEDGRKLHAATALVDAAGAVLAASRQLWIEPRRPL